MKNAPVLPGDPGSIEDSVIRLRSEAGGLETALKLFTGFEGQTGSPDPGRFSFAIRGMAPEEVSSFFEIILGLRLKVDGLLTIPPIHETIRSGETPCNKLAVRKKNTAEIIRLLRMRLKLFDKYAGEILNTHRIRKSRARVETALTGEKTLAGRLLQARPVLLEFLKQWRDHIAAGTKGRDMISLLSSDIAALEEQLAAKVVRPVKTKGAAGVLHSGKIIIGDAAGTQARVKSSGVITTGLRVVRQKGDRPKAKVNLEKLSEWWEREDLSFRDRTAMVKAILLTEVISQTRLEGFLGGRAKVLPFITMGRMDEGIFALIEAGLIAESVIPGLATYLYEQFEERNIIDEQRLFAVLLKNGERITKNNIPHLISAATKPKKKKGKARSGDEYDPYDDRYL